MTPTTKTTKSDGEYRVRLFVDGTYQAGADYFTDDKDDARETGAAMIAGCTADTTKETSVDPETVGIRASEQAEYNEATATPSHTPKDEVLGTLAAMGPLGFRSLLSGVMDQCSGMEERYTATLATVEAINDLAKSGAIALYDTGDAWDIS